LRLSNPVPLYKAIYEIYLRGVVKDLGVRLDVVGKCGIYKITNVVSGKVYVGQSVDVAERWKQHIKRGTKCDVGTLSGAGLYEAMWEDGIWNFSFCLLEECERSELNTHEKF
jgi:group I intron endonuclease